MRIDTALNWAIKQLEGGESPSVDAKVLLAHVLNKTQTYLFTWPDKTISPIEQSQYEVAVKRRLSGEPVAYIIGQRDFWTLSLKTSPHTLIPRPDTEILVEQVLHWAHQRLKTAPDIPLDICDLGTGTGAIALAVASELKDSKVIGVDFLLEAVTLATSNAKLNAISNATFKQSDWFSDLGDLRFDIIVSNPPYIEDTSPYLAQGDVRFEPKSALIACQYGLDDIKHNIKHAPQYLKAQGLLAFEHGFDQASRIQALLLEAGFSDVESVKDYGGNDRVTFGVISG